MNTKSASLMALYGWIVIFSLIPMLLILTTSFLSKDSTHLISLPFTLKNYTHLYSTAFANIALRSVGIALLTTCFCLLLAYPFSYLLMKSTYKTTLLVLIIIPFWTSSLVRTYSLISLLKFKGIINALLLTLHVIHTPLTMLYSNAAVIGGLVYTLFPFMVLPIFTQMERFDFRLMDAGRDLGANRWALFFRIFLPNTLPGIGAGCIMVFLPAMTLFYIPNILGGARSLLIGNMIQNQFLVLENWPEGAATSMVLTLTLIVFYLLYRRPKQGYVH